MRAIVTGAAGFIGSHLSERLLALGHEVIGVDKFSAYYCPALKKQNISDLLVRQGFTLVAEDIASEHVLSMVGDVDVIFHLAGQPGVRTSWTDFSLYLRENVEAVQTLLDAIALTGTRPRLVLASSSSVYGNAAQYPCAETSPTRPISPYGVSKLTMELLASAYVTMHGLQVVVLRYFTVYGPRQRPDMAFNSFIRSAVERRPIIVFGDGEQIRDFTFVDDVVDATIRAGTMAVDAGTTLNVCGGEPITVNGVLAVLRSLSGERLEVEYVGSALGDVRRTGGSSERANQLLEWSPTTSLVDGLRSQYVWQTRQGQFTENL